MKPRQGHGSSATIEQPGPDVKGAVLLLAAAKQEADEPLQQVGDGNVKQPLDEGDHDDEHEQAKHAHGHLPTTSIHIKRSAASAPRTAARPGETNRLKTSATSARTPESISVEKEYPFISRHLPDLVRGHVEETLL